jgi:hypothetical protein
MGEQRGRAGARGETAGAALLAPATAVFRGGSVIFEAAGTQEVTAGPPVGPAVARTSVRCGHAAPAAAATVAERVAAVLKTHPIRCGPSGALLVDWIVTASRAAALTGQELFAALLGGEIGAAHGSAACAAAQAARIDAEEKAQPRQ